MKPASLAYLICDLSMSVLVISISFRLYFIQDTKCAQPKVECHSVLPVSAGNSQDHLHDQRHRVDEHDNAQVHSQPARLSERRVPPAAFKAVSAKFCSEFGFCDEALFCNYGR
jgi:hypothetical protein